MGKYRGLKRPQSHFSSKLRRNKTGGYVMMWIALEDIHIIMNIQKIQKLKKEACKIECIVLRANVCKSQTEFWQFGSEGHKILSPLRIWLISM